MVDSRDQLFLRLCLRQGIYTKKEAQDLLAYYRDSAGVKEGIGHFLVREGYLEEEVANKLREAIAHRADGHVVDSRKKVPSLNKTRGAASAHGTRHHHVPAQPATVRADPMQLTLIAVGMIVAIVAVVWIIWEMNKGTDPGNAVVDSMEERKARVEAAREAEKKKKADAAREALASAGTEKVSYTASQIEEFENRAHEIRRTAQEASIDLGKGPRRGLEIIDAGLKTFREEGIPAEQVKILEEARTMVKDIQTARYDELKIELDKARTNGDTSRAEELLDQIKTECGEEFHERAGKG